MPPTTAVKHVSSYRLLVDGADLAKEFSDRVREVRIVSSLASPDVCTLKVLFAKPETPGGAWALDSMPFEVSRQLQVKLGDKESTTPSLLFTGEVVTVEPEYGAGGIQVSVRALDVVHRLQRSRHVRAFQQMTAADMVTKVCREAGLSVEADATPEMVEYEQQTNETDWEFIARLADRVGFELVCLLGKVHFRAPKGAGEPVELEYPTHLFQFHPKVTAVQQVDTVAVRGFDPKTKRPLAARKTTPAVIADVGTTRASMKSMYGGSSLLVATQPVQTQGQAEVMAQALLDRVGNGYATADGLTAGDPRVRAGALVKVTGVGKRFGGTYRVHTAIHTLKGGGVYETHWTSAPGYTIAGMLGTGAGGGAGGSAAPRFGGQLVIGLVTNNNDPDGLGRVRVKFPALGDDNESAWARIATPSAGPERGMLMLPQPDEEVIVGFEHGDVTRPYVLGSLFNGKDQPHDVIAARDGSLGIRSDQKIVTNSKKATELTSEDTFTLKAQSGMTISSDQALDVKATGAATFKSDQSLELQGAQSVKISTNGAQLQISAPSGMLEISAANLKLSASGMVQISGSQIMLG
jgi:phage protein D